MMYSQNGKNSAIILDGGCYENNEPAYYIRAQPDKLYKLEYIPVEVRSKYDPYTALAETGYNDEIKCSLITGLSYIAFLVAFLFAIITLIMGYKAKRDIGSEGEALKI